MWQGDFLKAGVEANGKDLNLFRGNIYAKNFPGAGDLGMVFGETAEHYYVDGDVTASGDGKSWGDAFKTITEAITAASDNDVIFVAPGTYDEGAELTITQDNLKLIGAGHYGVYVSWITNSSDYGLMTISGNGCIISGIELYQTEANYGVTVTGYSNRIQLCNIDGTATGTIGINLDSADWCVVENCTIYNWTTSAVEIDGDYDLVKSNIIGLVAGSIGIDYDEAAAHFNRIIGNVIEGANSTDTGISLIAGTTAEELSLAWNQVENCATPVTVGLDTALYDGNDWGKDNADYQPQANTFFVDANVAATGDGLCWKSAYKTITEAVAAATTRNDKIFVKPGDYDETATLAITTQGLQIIGVASEFNQNKAMVYDGGGAGYHLMTIDAHEVVIDGMAFSACADTYDAIHVGDTSASYKVTIKNCRFDGWSGEYGVKAGTSNDCPDVLIENNLFRSWNTAAVYNNCTRGVVRNNLIYVVTDKIGIEHVPNGSNRPDNTYMDNTFCGVSNATTTGIKFTGTPSNGACICVRNYFSGTFDVSITQTASYHGVNNYVADAAGGALIDTVT